ncbi:MAG: family 16 glycosylhydrolase [Thermanaerothrix sp.]|nr:family 16 glycosylhydrolase [Thermanaerothrix sp.]
MISLGSAAWRLSLGATSAGTYALAQLDDYLTLPRSRFHWHAPLRLELEARASASNLPGTWGFGLWNDPFAMPLGVRGSARRWPVLPNALWFFYASSQNALALRDDLPLNGFLSATFSAPTWPGFILLPALPLLLGLLWPPTARSLRRLLRQFIHQDAVRLELDVTTWHHYSLHWQPDHAGFSVDGQVVFETTVVPRGRLGLVIWMDNQYAAFTPQGQVRFGLEAMPSAWLEIRGLRITPE